MIKTKIRDSLLAGLVEKELREKNQNVKMLHMNYATPQDLKQNSTFLTQWIKDQHIKYLAVHFD